MSDSEGVNEPAKRGRSRAKKAAEPRSVSKDSDEPKAKRGRGRPKGTTKKAKKASTGNSVDSGKRRGRPKKGAAKESKNLSDQGGSGGSEEDD